ncbi:MAG TPA: nucleotidyltransferase family protein [Actinomycetota bacterium]|jgi:hypothetical protein
MSNDAKDQEEAAKVFRELVSLFEDEGFDYAVGGGIATDHWKGDLEFVADIDVVIREEDAPAILSLLGSNGYETAEMEHSWLHKAFKGSVTVDLIFELKNGTRIDGTFLERCTRAGVLGTLAPVMSAEDQVASLTATLDRETVGKHWYNVIDIVSNNDLDWDYVVERSQADPLRMLAIVSFALSEDVPIPSGVVDRLLAMAEDSKR